MAKMHYDGMSVRRGGCKAIVLTKTINIMKLETIPSFLKEHPCVDV